MDKFSFFDFLAYLIPGGSTLLFLYYTAYDCIPGVSSISLIDSAYMVLPFLFLAYILGHLISLAGIALEDACYAERNVFSQFAVKRPQDTLILNKLSERHFGFQFIKDGQADESQMKLFFHKVTDLHQCYPFFFDMKTLHLISCSITARSIL